MTAAELPSRRFEPLRYGLGAWTEHIFFAYDLVAELRPQVLVELGTDRGESYFAFCQSALENHTGTRCFAVDHWQGDTHAGSYDDATFADVCAHNSKHYASFSILLRCSFDAALEQFAPASIDLLHIDGCHTEESARHDVESWLPKLRPGGILLMHDVAVRVRDFGVWKVWAELRERGRSFAFETSPGLGVWEKPPAQSQPALLEALMGRPERIGAKRDEVEGSRGVSGKSGSRSGAITPRDPSTALRSAQDDGGGERLVVQELCSNYRERNAALQEKMTQQWLDGSIRTAPMASETVIQVFWQGAEGYAEERSIDARIGHESWKEVKIPLPASGPVSGLRIDFFSALTIVEIAEISVGTAHGIYSYRATTKAECEAISLGGDCVRLSAQPFRVQITGVDPQLYLPRFSPALDGNGLVVSLRLRVEGRFANALGG